uniref:Ig-like domain-containing protein n=1 Tax=Anopheles dirus TaxID=7168 RepID=A0A182N285_9DIPT
YVTGDISTSLALSKLNSGATFFAGPYLDGSGVSNVTTQIGTHAYLPCKVKQLGNKSVSWVRVRDDHILTVDRMTFIADERFQSFYVESSGVWTLQIKYVQARDAGIYECQVSTEPKISARVHLHVVVWTSISRLPFCLRPVPSRYCPSCRFRSIASGRFSDERIWCPNEKARS